MRRRTFESLSAFATIVERGSFVRAAAHLGVTPSALSQTIRGLEEELGADMVGVRVGGGRGLVVVGTPRYFARHERPRQPKDLLAHRCVVHFRSGGEAYRWEFEKGGRERQVAVTGAVFENDAGIAL